MKPGTSMVPGIEITSVSSPMKGAMKSALPTARISSPRLATASAQGLSSTPVQMRASVMTSEAGS